MFPLVAFSPVLLWYVLVFGAAGAVCLLSLPRTRVIQDPDTRRGLFALLALSGVWAATHVGFLAAPTPWLGEAFYLAGLIVGVSTVGPWLYFCSAYTGRTLHRNPVYRRLLVVPFLVVVVLKLTNPLHQFYYTTEFVTAPFPHLVVTNGLVHWVVMGLSYALAAIGYFMLFEFFTQVGHDTRSLLGLAGLTSLPVVLDIVGLASPRLLEINYEPLGVAAFAVGLLFAFLDDFRRIQLAADQDDAVFVLGEDNRLRDYNRQARALFPELADLLGEHIDTVIPGVTEHLESNEAVLAVERAGGMRYYRSATNSLAPGEGSVRLLILDDVTDRERYRRELQRQNERLDQFASMVSHDLRNPLNVAQGTLAEARKARDSTNLETAADALDRMETLIEDMLALARTGQPIDETEPVVLSTVTRAAWSVVETAEADLVVESDCEFVADPDRLQQLLENLFRNAVEHGRSDATVSVGAIDDRSGFYVADDGPGIPADEREQVLESGYSTAEDGTGFGLAIVSEIVQAHGWTITVTDSRAGGARFEICGVEPVESLDDAVDG